MSGLARFTTPPPSPPADPLAEVAAPLQAFLRPRRGPAPGEACELCAVGIPATHRHVVDLAQRSLLCTCRGCALLFEAEPAADGRYRSVPERYLRVAPFTLDPAHWAALQVPVGVAFVVHATPLGAPVAFYPSPGGATESELSMDAWQDVVADNPVLEDVRPDVEAVLVRSDRGAGAGADGPPACWVTPVDRCYELVGRLRLSWRGFDGGQEARAALQAFFADVDGRSRPTGGTP